MIDQLDFGGRLIGPIGKGETQVYTQIDKQMDGTIIRKDLFGVRYRQLS